MSAPVEDVIARAHRLIAHLPGVEIAPWYGRPALTVGGKGFASPGRVAGAMAILCPEEVKTHLLADRPDLYFETDHYRGSGWLLVRLDIDDEMLRHRLEAAWMARAPAPLLRAWHAGD